MITPNALKRNGTTRRDFTDEHRPGDARARVPGEGADRVTSAARRSTSSSRTASSRIVGQIPRARHDPGQAEFLRGSADMTRLTRALIAGAPRPLPWSWRDRCPPSGAAGPAPVPRRQVDEALPGRTPTKPGEKIAGDFDKVKVLEPGGRGRRARCRDGHRDPSGRLLSEPRRADASGRVPDPRADHAGSFDPTATCRGRTGVQAGRGRRYLHPTPYGSCPPGGTPTSITRRRPSMARSRSFSLPGRVWLLTEFPQTIR